jgi:hypothetical protein
VLSNLDRLCSLHFCSRERSRARKRESLTFLTSLSLSLSLSLRLHVHVRRNTNVPDDSIHSPEQLKLQEFRGRCHLQVSLQKANTEHTLYVGVYTHCIDVRTLYICVCMDFMHPMCMARVIPGRKICHETRKRHRTGEERPKSPLERGGGGGGGGGDR